MRDGLISEIIQHRMKSRWFWRDYLIKTGMMKRRVFDIAEYRRRMQQQKTDTRMSTGNRFGEILTRNGDFVSPNREWTYKHDGRAIRYKLASGGYSNNYSDPAFDVS